MNNRIQITSVPNYKTRSTPFQLSKSIVQTGGKESLDLPGIKDWMGRLWIPTYLPDGYELEKTDATREVALHLHFRNPDKKSKLILYESPKPADLHIPHDTYQQVLVRGQTGFLVSGAFVHNQNYSKWQESLCLYLVFEIDGWTINLMGLPAKEWSGEELVKIAESLKTY
jgi:hypothetical protein